MTQQKYFKCWFWENKVQFIVHSEKSVTSLQISIFTPMTPRFTVYSETDSALKLHHCLTTVRSWQSENFFTHRTHHGLAPPHWLNSLHPIHSSQRIQAIPWFYCDPLLWLLYLSRFEILKIDFFYHLHRLPWFGFCSSFTAFSLNKQ